MHAHACMHAFLISKFSRLACRYAQEDNLIKEPQAQPLSKIFWLSLTKDINFILSFPSLSPLLPPPSLPHSYHLMQNCWKRYTSDRPHFELILNTLTSYMDRLKRPDSVYYSDSETDDEGENNVQRQGSGKLPSRTPSIREGKGSVTNEHAAFL